MTDPTRAIFLDVDGVLNSAAWFARRGARPPERPHFDHAVDPGAITRLNRLCQATGAGIVVSSIWRHGASLRQLRADFARVGCDGKVVGKTPDLPGRNRGAEIAAWLETHPPITAFVILDDDADMGTLGPQLVQTAVATGLTDGDVDRAIVLLRAEG